MFQPQIPVALSYIKDSVVVSQNKNQTNTKAYKRRSKFNDKVLQMKNKSWTCANREYINFSGDVSTSPSLWFSPYLDNSWCISSNPCEKTSKRRFSHYFSMGCISSDKQIGFLLHIILGQKCI